MRKKQITALIAILICIFVIDVKPLDIAAKKTEEITEELSSASNIFYVYEKQELYEVLSEQLMNRSKNFYIDYQGSMDQELKKIGRQLNSEKTETYWKGMYTLLQNMAESVDDPFTTSDSDYLTGIIDSSFIYYIDGLFCFESMTYYETAAQTQKVDTKIDKVLKRFNLYEEADPIAAVDRIHRYIINRVAYDYRNENKCNYSAYDGIFHQRTVCNGYALLAYKMLNALEIPCKYISGMAENDDGEMQLHAWNMVKIGKKWYNLDITWDDNDDGRIYYDYFLQGNKMFEKDHKPDIWYQTDSFLKKYKISKKNYQNLL